MKPVNENASMREGERRFERLAARLLTDPGVSEGTGFGRNPGLRVEGRIFAMLSGSGELVVKLPRDRIDGLVESRTGQRFDPRRDGRVMKEWATVPAAHGRQWSRLVDEALTFVRSAAS